MHPRLALALGVLLAAAPLARNGAMAAAVTLALLGLGFAFKAWRRDPAWPAYALGLPVAVALGWWGADLPFVWLAFGGLAVWVARDRRAFAWQVLAVAAVAWLSGSAGGAGSMVAWLVERGVPTAVAENAVLVLRKSIHFGFYGTLALVSWRGMRSVEVESRRAMGYGLGVALVVAAFDESRQFASAGRTGAVGDVALDLAGAAAFLLVAHRRALRPPSSGRTP